MSEPSVKLELMASHVERIVQLQHQYLLASLHLKSLAMLVVLKPCYGSTAMADEAAMSEKVTVEGE